MLHRNLRGSDLHSPSTELVENNSGSLISKLKVVGFTELGAAYPQIFVADSTVDIVRGVVQCDILNGKTGYITCLGFLNECDTSAWTPGTELYGDASGNLTSVVTGLPVAIVLKQDVNNGILYVDTYGFNAASIITSLGAWVSAGNAGFNPLTAQLGTLDTVPLRFTTNNVQRAILDVSGNWGFGELNPDFPIVKKFHSGYTDSGVRENTFAITSSDTLFHSIYSLSVTQDWVLMAEFSVVAKEGATNRASFRRTVTFHKNGANLVMSIPQSDYTYKSDVNFDVQISVAGDTFNFEIKNANPTATTWIGSVKISVSV